MEDLILTPGADDKRRQLVKVCVIFLILSSVRVRTMLCSILLTIIVFTRL